MPRYRKENFEHALRGVPPAPRKYNVSGHSWIVSTTSPIQLPGVTRYSLQVKHGLAGNGTRSLGGKAYRCVAATSLKVRIRADTAHAVQRGMRLRQHAAFGDAELPDSVEQRRRHQSTRLLTDNALSWMGP